ncbi:MAG: LysM peptidoglycan-binding domain-containing protein [Halanaerobiales bacterium]|jgi:LysM repeat protein|nr:LysM peptidoglycan-binding domain-containing protein [Bacillota bacterium]HOA41405.1 LysM peptidoglycan-binding domain-containing protein [Halanaerobiales bacterium]HPZ63525.1 LysM peptidoglycan-binding domain-containing protein [Halanaerobiales bacterium]HQD04765.1 LysM peptidoglycan-binding domain-containing protein [Halanaerobiales bacterium]
MKKGLILTLLVFMVFTNLLVVAADYYTVKTGDSLWAISQKTGITIEELSRLNNINNPNSLYIGQRLYLGNKTENNSGNNSNKNYIRYTVKTGDLLWKIARDYKVEIRDIISLNKMEAPYYIYIGQILLIPTEDRDNKPAGGAYFYYTVQPGDILWNIAQKYGTTVQKLVELNDIKDAYDLYVGRKLMVPLKESKPVEEKPAENNKQEENKNYLPYTFYKVQKGDRIWQIAQTFGIKTNTLVNFNKLKNVNDIKVGDILVIPLKDSSKFTYLYRAASQVNSYYRVLRNDTLAGIAEYYGIPEEGIRAINGLKKNEGIYTGQRLLMPVNPALFKQHKIYTVKKGGEYIFDIAFENSISIKSILKANYLRDQNTRFEEGTVIIIPLDQESKATWIEYENGKPVNSWFNANK